MDKTVSVEFNSKRLIFYGTVRGAYYEIDDLDKLFQENGFDLILLGISPEELDGMKKYMEKPFDVELSDYEIIWGLKLRDLTKVKLPVPSYYHAVVYSIKNNVEIKAIDMNDDEYAKCFTRNVSFFDLLRHSLKKNRILKRRFRSKTPEEFSLEWDRIVNRGGYKKLEMERERYMTERIRENSKGNNILIIIDFERMDNIVSSLKHQEKN